MSAILRLFYTRDAERIQLAAEKANADPSYWSPYLDTATPSDVRRDRAERLREASKRAA